MKSAVVCGAVLAVAIATSGVAQVQQVSGGRAPVGGRTLVAVSFAGTPAGDFPAGIEPNTGALEVVDKNGQRMLRATSESSFLVTLPELMPQDFLLEFDLIPKTGHGGYDFSVEGTKEIDQGPQSINLLWHSTNVRGVGGGGTNGFDAPMPEAVRVGLAGAPTTVAVAVTNQRIQFFANGTLTHTLPNRRFARSRILRIALGGENADDGAVYLSSFRVAAMGAAATVATNQNASMGQNGGPNFNGGGGPGGAPGNAPSGVGSNAPQPNGIANLTVTDTPAGPLVTWTAVTGATYLVQRWLDANPACCASASPANPALTSLSWQDTPLPFNGAYTYRVTATTSSGSSTTQASFNYTSAPASGRQMPTPTTTPTTSVQVPASPGAIASGPLVTQPATTTPSVQVPASPGAMVSGPLVVQPATTTTTNPTMLPAAPAGAAATFPNTTSTNSGNNSGSTTACTGGTSGVSGGASSTPLSGGAAGTSMMPNTCSTANNTSNSNTATSATTGGYRVTMTGLTVTKPTIDDPLDRDGKADEIYANAIVVRWDRKGSQWLGTSIVKSRDYGDIGNSNNWPARIKAGTASQNTGGITSGNTVPSGFAPTSAFGPPMADQFPMVVWQGTLTDGGEAIVLFPSVWEKDLDPVGYNNYTTNWKTNSAPVLTSQLLLNQYASPTLKMETGPGDPNTVGQAAAGPTFTGPNYGVHVIPGTTLMTPSDRLIGMMTISGTLAYPERIVVITHEKLANLQPGQHTDIPIPLIESALGADGIYTLYLRIERIS
jgi:hypothetical protein